jgi:hypothetical protein
MLKTIFYESSDQTNKQYDNNDRKKRNENIKNSYQSPHRNQDSIIEGSRGFVNDF